MPNDQIRIRLSWGLLAVVLIHAVATGFIAQQTNNQNATRSSDWTLPAVGFEQSPSGRTIETLPQPANVNMAAQGEIKQQAPCLPCQQTQPGRPLYINGERVIAIGPSRVVPNVSVPIMPATRPSSMAAPVAKYDTPPPKKSYQLALFIDGSEKAHRLQDWFEGDPKLRELRGKCEFQIYTPSSVLYQQRFAEIVPVSQFPVVLFQDATGGHIHAAGGTMIPSSPAALFDDLQTGYTLYKQAKQGDVRQTGAVKTKGYSWDASINPTMQLATSTDCPGGQCPTPDASWRPGDRLRDRTDDLFDGSGVRNAFLWANSGELSTIALIVIAGVLVLYIIHKRGS
ncbi:hypothetical protein K227x_64420 [Rubripirellula lacrimiformis]|uniref:Uncharacterized protein n=1 Tax=Rubripirellula lacrimiformis TaxID=1930273 RepID=A0A517NLK9_9BACT|nr:hypothetical protein [Rubripirellula lacrimiformis]QDT08012.1 hypothetical protein K227x_64420 [Rubripirellula lacrimiformis]